MPVKTGLSKLDSLFKGGLPEKTTVLLLGPPKSGKTLLGLQYLFSGLSADEYGICIVTNNFPEDLVKRFQPFGEVDEFLKKGLLHFVDCYSIHAGVEKESTVFIIRVNGPTALTEIGITMSKIFTKIPKGKKVRIIVDSVSTLLLYNRPTVVAEFIQSLANKTKSLNASAFFMLEEGMHEEKDITMVNSMLDAVFILKQKDKRRYIEVTGFGQENAALDYRIEDGRIKCS